MKKVLFKRVFASTLAGALALSLPLTAMAAAGEGGTEGDASVVGGDGDFFSVVLPTNTASNVDFTVDPQNHLAKGHIDNVDPDDYDGNTHLYFTRVNYDDLLMGNKGDEAVEDKDELAYKMAHAEYYWGNVQNKNYYDTVTKTNRDDGAQYMYGNTSNWMTITNKSAKPVTVELTVKWDKTSDVRIVTDKNDLGKSAEAAIYMEVQASEGRTDDIYDYSTLAAAATTADKSYALDYVFQSLNADKGKIDVDDKTVGNRRLNWAYDKGVLQSDGKTIVLPPQEMPVATKQSVDTVVTWVIPTINQAYDILHDDVNYRAIDKIIAAVPNKFQAYYLRAYYFDPVNALDGRQEVAGFELWNNRNDTYKSGQTKPVYAYKSDKLEGVITNEFNDVPFVGGVNGLGQDVDGYDKNINIYPTYGFRLAGETNVSGWDQVKEMPRISLSWKVTIGEPNEAVAVVNENPVVLVEDLDIKGVIDDTQFFNVYSDGTTLKSITASALNGEYVDEKLWVEGVSETVNTDGILDAGTMPMVTVDSTTFKGDFKVNINIIALMNWSIAGFFKNDGVVELTYTFVTSTGKELPVVVVLRDSRNGVQ